MWDLMAALQVLRLNAPALQMYVHMRVPERGGALSSSFLPLQPQKRFSHQIMSSPHAFSCFFGCTIFSPTTPTFPQCRSLCYYPRSPHLSAMASKSCSLSTPPKCKSSSLFLIPLLCSILLLSILCTALSFWHSPAILDDACPSYKSLSNRGASLYHSWTDEELFERAVAADKLETVTKSKGPPKFSSYMSFVYSSYSCRQHSCLDKKGAEPKIAFLFMTTGMLPFAPLWNEFFRGYEELFNIYVHLDPFQVNLFNRSTGVFWGRLVPSDKTQRGSALLIAAARRLLANALLDDPLNKYFAIISDHCIPLHGFKTVYSQLVRSNKSYLEILDSTPTLHSRYVARGEEAMLPEVPFSKFSVGSQFFIVTRKHARMIVADKKYWKKFSLPCRRHHSCYAEEHYFPTLMEMEDPQGSTGYSLTFVNWNESRGGHPKSYGRKEVNRELIASMQREGRFLFARKFEDSCLDVLLQLSPFILKD